MDNLNTTEFLDDLHIKELQPKNLSLVTLDGKRSKELAKKLNILLANYSVFYQNVRGYHWNLKGKNFFLLHVKFEELYTSLFLSIDEIAERIVTIGHPAHHNFSQYKILAKITERNQVTNSIKDAEDILSSLRILINCQKEILSFSTEIGDEGTHLLMSDNIKTQEKLAWMYAAFLEK